ncbi:DUF4176 domain-containing protein [Peribacillus simplex]|nr:DUF4176 domain-containing protein [Peribacillus simplex]
MSKRFQLILMFLLLTLFLLAGCNTAESNKDENKDNIVNKELDKSKLLPIGTVVKLEKVEKAVMIYGYNQIQVSTGKKYDYIAVPYPEGNLSEEYNVFFNREVIENVLYSGYITEEEKKFRKEIDSKIKTIN